MLQNIAADENTLKDLKYLTTFSHAVISEVYHTLYNNWVIKRQHFLSLETVTSNQLAIMDFKKDSELERGTTKIGGKRHNVIFLK